MFSYVGVDDRMRGLIWIKLLKAEELRDGAGPNAYHKIINMEKHQIEVYDENDEEEIEV